jgi:hypothetical protein
MIKSAVTKYEFETGVYRPPSEGGSNSLLVRLTRNCPWNHCTFCGMYKTEKFQVRSVADIKQDIDAMAAVRDDLAALSRQAGGGGEIGQQAAVDPDREKSRIELPPGLCHALPLAAFRR